MEEEIRIYQNRNRRFLHIAHFLILSIACLAISFHFYLNFGKNWYSNFLLVVFLLILPSYIMKFAHHFVKFFSNQPLFVLTKEGIWNHSHIGMHDLIRWEEIEHIFVRQAMLTISGDQVALYNSEGLVAILSLQATSITGTDLVQYIEKQKQK